MKDYNSPESNQPIKIGSSNYEDVNEHEKRMKKEEKEFYKNLVNTRKKCANKEKKQNIR